MTDFFWPADIVPARQSWRIVDATATFSSIFTGVTRTYSRPGTRLATTLELRNVHRAQRHRLIGLLAALNGREHRIWLPDFATARRGSHPAEELLSNTGFATTTGWTSSDTELVLKADSGRLRLERTAVDANRYASIQSAATASGWALLFRAGLLSGRGPLGYRLQLGTSATGSELAAGSALTSEGLQHLVGAATGTTTYASVRDDSSGRSAGHFQFVDQPSLARCALVMGASQTGHGLAIDALPASTDGLLLAGDIVSIYTQAGWEPKRLTRDLNSNSSGEGFLCFEPALRAAPLDNAPIAIHRPLARFVLAEEITWDTGPGLFSDFMLEFVEDIA